MITNCVNCGAPLRGTKCDYCGTEYSKDRSEIKAKFSRDDAFGVIQIDGNEYRVYLARMDAECLYLGTGRNMDGTLCRGKAVLKHKFTLIEA